MIAQKVVNTKDLSREQWLEHRKTGIGGSDAGPILGLSKWSSALDVYLDKLGLVDETEQTERMYWGNRLENIVAEEFAVRNPGVTVKRNNFILQHPEHSFMYANLDRVFTFTDGRTGVLECKTVGGFALKHWKDDEGKFQIGRLGWIADYPIYDNFLYSIFQSKSGDNKSKFSDPTVDAALEAARSEGDAAKRIAAYQEIDTKIQATNPVVPLMYYAHRHVGSDRVHDLYYGPQGLAGLDKAWLTNGGAAK